MSSVVSEAVVPATTDGGSSVPAPASPDSPAFPAGGPVPRPVGPAGTAALMALRDRVQAVHEAVHLVRDDGATPATARRVRDAASRLAALLGSLDPVLPAAASVDVRRTLGSLAERGAALADAEVGRALAEQMLAAVPRALVTGPVSDRLRHHQRERARDASDALTAAVADGSCAAMLAAADRLVITPPLTEAAAGKPAKVLARCAVADDDRLAAAVVATREDAPGTGGGRAEVRAAALALAGSADAAAAEHGKKARRLAAAADELVAAVDDVVDTVRLQRLLVDLADVAHRHREPGFTYGLLHAQATTRGELARARLDVALDEVARDKLRTWLR